MAPLSEGNAAFSDATRLTTYKCTVAAATEAFVLSVHGNRSPSWCVVGLVRGVASWYCSIIWNSIPLDTLGIDRYSIPVVIPRQYVAKLNRFFSILKIEPWLAPVDGRMKGEIHPGQARCDRGCGTWNKTCSSVVFIIPAFSVILRHFIHVTLLTYANIYSYVVSWAVHFGVRLDAGTIQTVPKTWNWLNRSVGR